jgi:hypothetical protein
VWKEEDVRGHNGQSTATQTAPKFGPRLRLRGQTDENALDRWAGFFPTPVKKRAESNVRGPFLLGH